MVKVILITKEGKKVEVDQDVALKSNTVKDLFESCEVQDKMEIPVEEVDSATLEKVLEFCTRTRDVEYVAKAEDDDQRIELTDEDNRYLDVSHAELVTLLNAANFLHVPGLIDIICQFIANMIKGKTTEQIREIYGFADDLSPEEKEELRKRYEWVDN